MNEVYCGDNLSILKEMKSESVNLIYIDPPFNTGKVQKLGQIKVERSEDGDRTGYQGLRYKTTKVGNDDFYADSFDDYETFLKPRLEELYRILAPNGTLCFHIDYREVHYCKVLLDRIFGRKSFLNEVIWHWDYGAKSKKKWSCKHNSILIYVKSPSKYTFNLNEVDRVPYLAPGLAGKVKAKRGKLITDVWWHTIVCGKERTGYPTQKPLGIIKRLVKVHSNVGDTVLDCFAGSGVAGVAAHQLGRNFILIDKNEKSIDVIKKQFHGIENISYK